MRSYGYHRPRHQKFRGRFRRAGRRPVRRRFKRRSGRSRVSYWLDHNTGHKVLCSHADASFCRKAAYLLYLHHVHGVPPQRFDVPGRKVMKNSIKHCVNLLHHHHCFRKYKLALKAHKIHELTTFCGGGHMNWNDPLHHTGHGHHHSGHVNHAFMNLIHKAEHDVQGGVAAVAQGAAPMIV
nr:hypothetical protein [Crucivirus sp.]